VEESNSPSLAVEWARMVKLKLVSTSWLGRAEFWRCSVKDSDTTVAEIVGVVVMDIVSSKVAAAAETP